MGKSQYNQRRFLPGDRVHLTIAPHDVHILDVQAEHRSGRNTNAVHT